MARIAHQEGVEGGKLPGLQVDPCKQIPEPLAPPLGLHRKQGAPGKALQEAVKGQQGLLLAVVELQIRQGARGRSC